MIKVWCSSSPKSTKVNASESGIFGAWEEEKETKKLLARKLREEKTKIKERLSLPLQ